MPPAPYVDPAVVKSILNITASSGPSVDRVAAACDAATDSITQAAARDFHVVSETGEDAERFYVVERPLTLEIDDCLVIHEVAIDRQGNGSYSLIWDEDVDFMVEPLNALVKGRPFERLKPRAARARRFYPGDTVRVTGIFGWPEIPPNIVSYATTLAVRYYNRPNAAFGIATFGIEAIAIPILRQDPDFQLALGPYLRDTVVYG